MATTTRKDTIHAALVHGATVVHYDRDLDTIAAITAQPVTWIIPAGSARIA